MSNDAVLDLQFTPDPDQRHRHDGWGLAMLRLAGRPLWYAESANQPSPIRWTWVDLLEHLARSWPYLLAEQAYPMRWLDQASHPGELWRLAQRRWAHLHAQVADEEEPILLAFDRRHNLAAGFKGLALPALSWHRVGATVWLCPEEGPPIRAPFHSCVGTMENIGNQLAQAFIGSGNPRVAAAIDTWNQRQGVLEEDFLELATGLSRTQLQQLQDGQDSRTFWELPGLAQGGDGWAAEGVLLAAARMTSGILDLDAVRRVLENIRRLKRRHCEALDALSKELASHLAGTQTKFAFEAGYAAAAYLRAHLPELQSKNADIGGLLDRLDVEVATMDFGTDRIDAVAVWGARGPCIALNTARKYSGSDERTRMTLAHELCHLMLDRAGGLPFCEVLGGRVDDFIERRAKAFAAELLLPRAFVEHEWTQWRGEFQVFLTLLRQVYGLSKTAACAQVHNSSVFAQLPPPSQAYVTTRLMNYEGRSEPMPIRSAGGLV